MQPASVNESVSNKNKINNKYARINSLVSDILCEMTGKCEVPHLAKKSCCGEK